MHSAGRRPDSGAEVKRRGISTSTKHMALALEAAAHKKRNASIASHRIRSHASLITLEYSQTRRVASRRVKEVDGTRLLLAQVASREGRGGEGTRGFVTLISARHRAEPSRADIGSAQRALRESSQKRRKQQRNWTILYSYCTALLY